MKSLQNVIRDIDGFNKAIGHATAWLALVMVVTQFVVVGMRYIFGIGSIMMQESIVYLHSFVFLVGAGYTLLRDGHVRVDLFYSKATERQKAAVDLAGVIFFLIPVSILIGFYAWPYIAQSWAVLEGSKETSGIQAVFLLKTLILVFCGVMIIQGIGMALRSILVLLEMPIPDSNQEEIQEEELL